MERWSRLAPLVTWLLLFVALPVTADAQVFVYPRRPGQTNVRYDEFDWKHINILAGEDADVETTDPGPRGGADPVSFTGPAGEHDLSPTYPLLHPGSGGFQVADPTAKPPAESAAADRSRIEQLTEQAGGLKLFYYASEKPAARRAVNAIEESYIDLMEDFDFAPPKTFPFILYNSYTEFLQTNLFPIREGVLGVTSPRNLKLTLPYFGDHRQFRRVAHHELVHQFTIQKVNTVASNNDAFRNPLEGIPLWFIEGLAEYYTHDKGLDGETEMLVRDLAVHQAPERGYALGSFFQQGPRSYLWIYKVGQARVAFLEETYGSGTLQKLLDESYRLGRGNWQEDHLPSFQALVQEVTGEKPKKVASKFENWVKERAYQSYLGTSQKHGTFPQLDKIDRFIRGFDASPDGNVLLYKSINRTTGQNQIFLADRRDLRSETRLIIDSNPGVESLHPLESRSFDIDNEQVVFLARARGRDIIYRQSYRTKTEKTETHDPDNPAKAPVKEIRTRIKTGSRTGYKLKEKGLLAAETPAIAPDGRRIAFIGLGEAGQKDIYILTPKGDNGDYSLTQITDDPFAERGLDWGEQGLVFSSDQTGHGRYNIFRIDPTAGAEAERLTSAPVDHLDVQLMSDGRVMFVAFDEGRANLYTVAEDHVVRKTDITTGLFNPSPGPDGGAWALFHYAGRRVPVQLTSETLGSFNHAASTPDVASRDLELRTLDESNDYKPLALRNWELNNGFGILGVSGEGIFGQLYASASDRLRNHQLLLELVAFGSFRRTDGSLTYINQENRLIWGLSLFQDFKFRFDETFADRDIDRFLSFERYYGGRGLLRYPFSRFAYTQLALSAGGTSYFLSDGATSDLQEQTPMDAPQPLDEEWKELRNSPRFQTEAELSFGFDNIHYQYQTGPVSGTSLLASAGATYQPFDDTLYGSFRVDGEAYIPIYRRINLFFRAGSGVTVGDELARQFFLSSFYTLRGVPFGTLDFLLGDHFLFSTVEFQFPLNPLVRVPFIDLEGIIGMDFGGVGDSYSQLWNRRVLDAAFGVNFGFGPIVLRLHFAKPIDIGAEETPNDGKFVPNLSLGWRYL